MCSVSVFLLPGLAIGPQRREQESEEQKPLFRPGCDPAAEGESNSIITWHHGGKQTHNR